MGEGELLRILCSYEKNCFNKPSAGELLVSAYTDREKSEL